MAKPIVILEAEVSELRPKKRDIQDSNGRTVKIIDPDGAMNLSIVFTGGNLNYIEITAEQASHLIEDETYLFTFAGKAEVLGSGNFINLYIKPIKEKLLAIKPS